jgi:hypothetical protein
MPRQTYMTKIGAIALAAAAGWALCLSGCTSVMYDSNPEAPLEEAPEKPDFASRTVQNLMATCIRWAAERYPPPEGVGDGWFAINLPPGLTREQYIEVARQIGDRAAPVTPEVEYLPTYHIGWVWMRGDDARVDVIRPVYALSTGGAPVYQAITLHLSRRYASWRVDRTQPWEPGVVRAPELYYMPELPPEEIPSEEEAGGEAAGDTSTGQEAATVVLPPEEEPPAPEPQPQGEDEDAGEAEEASGEPDDPPAPLP